MLAPGTPAPPFDAPDERGRAWSLDALRARRFVLTFYPKDETAGCTAQVCAFRDAWAAFEAEGVLVFGVSRDDAHSHEAFVRRRHLPYSLLTDATGAMHKAYDVGRIFGVTRRVSYLVGADGRIEAAYQGNLRPDAHAAKMLSSVRAPVRH